MVLAHDALVFDARLLLLPLVPAALSALLLLWATGADRQHHLTPFPRRVGWAALVLTLAILVAFLRFVLDPFYRRAIFGDALHQQFVLLYEASFLLTCATCLATVAIVVWRRMGLRQRR